MRAVQKVCSHDMKNAGIYSWIFFFEREHLHICIKEIHQNFNSGEILSNFYFLFSFSIFQIFKYVHVNSQNFY